MAIEVVSYKECNHACCCPKCANWRWDREDIDLNEPLYRDMVEMYGQPLGEGRDRIVFDRGDGWVVKYPKGKSGRLANREEEVAFRCDPKGKSYPKAACYMEQVEDVPLLHMEAVVTKINFTEFWADERRDWVNQNAPWANALDSCQVGWTKEGRLVAYDYAG